MSLDINLINIQSIPIVVNANITAENNKVYHVIANATFTDPTPVEGRGYFVVVRNASSCVLGGNSYIAGETIHRIFHSGSWLNIALRPSTYVPISRTINGLDLSANRTLTTANINDSTNKRYVTDAQLTVLGNTSGTNTGDQNLSGLVPYTGATADVDLGNNDLNAEGIKIKGTAGNGHLNLKHQSSDATAGGSESVLYADNTGNPKWKNDGNAVQNVMLENSAITGATKTKITYDSKGLVTAGSDATTADIADSTNKRYVTDAQLTVLSNTSGTNTGDETQSTILSKLGWFKTTVTTNYSVTGTTGETIASSTQVPTLSNGTIFKINTLRISKGAVSGTTIRAYLSPNNNNLSGALQILATGSVIVTGVRLSTISRVFEIEGGNIKGFNSATGVMNDNGTSTAVGLDSALPSGTLYLIVTVTNSAVGETTIQELLDISNF